MPAQESFDVAVVGGGVVGLGAARELAARGARVVVLDAGLRPATDVAAGMLAPVSEAEVNAGPSGRDALALGLEAASAWPGFAATLADASGLDVALRATGTLVLARDADEALALEREAAVRESLGLDVARLRPREARVREAALAPTLRAALDVPGDHSVDPRVVLRALRAACATAGVRTREGAEVVTVAPDAAVLAGGERVAADRVVVAAGAWSARLVDVPVRPVKGQILRLRDPAGAGLVERVLRFEGGYLVPRGDGRYVLGATVEERGFDTSVTAGGVFALLREATELVPGLDELELEEAVAGLRPGTPDNLPLLGRAPDGVVLATGHHRNGILLAPLTARLVADLVAGDASDPLLAACDPARFAVAVPA